MYIHTYTIMQLTHTLNNSRIYNHCDIDTNGKIVRLVSCPQQVDDDGSIALIDTNTCYLKLNGDYWDNSSCKWENKVYSQFNIYVTYAEW